MTVISNFKNEYYFLSNLFEVPVEYGGKTFRTAESAFQAQKDASRADEFMRLKGSDARSLGEKVEPRQDWDQVRVQIMREVVECKFKQNRWLMQKLMNTGKAQLVQESDWNDTFWGVYKGKGENMLGKILMEIRDKELSVRNREISEAVDYMDQLADDAFVPNSSEQRRPNTQLQKLRQEAGDYNAVQNEKAELTLSEILKGQTIRAGRWENPENGVHQVVLDGDPEVKLGRNGNDPYAVFELRDVKTQIVWKTFISAKDIVKTITEISFNNRGFLGGMNAQKALNNIQKNHFRCWTVEDKEKKIRTYFDEEKANKALYIANKLKSDGELRKLREKEREDAEKGQEEDAELTRKAKAENNDLPSDI